MKVVFLDIDGVLNSDTYEGSCEDDKVRIDPSRVKLLAELVASTGAKIVLTSTWRLDWNKIPLLCGEGGKYLNERFAAYGLSILDKTPFLGLLGSRQKEILTWLSQYGDRVESFVILDDMDSGWDKLEGRVVVTDPRGAGLEEAHVQKARVLLNKRISFP